MDRRGAEGIVAATAMQEAYKGATEGGRFHGFGAAVLAGGNEYRGQFAHGRIDGVGTMVWLDGLKYVGEWRCNTAAGLGFFSWPDKAEYFGEVSHGQRHGVGVHTHGSVRYAGEWAYGKRHGIGVLATEKSIYYGEWVDGKRHGWGRVQFASGNRYHGNWKNDKFCGFGQMVWVSLKGTHKEAPPKFDISKFSSHRDALERARAVTANVGSLVPGPLGPYVPARIATEDIYERYTGEWVDNEQHGRGTYEFILHSHGSSRNVPFDTINRFVGSFHCGQREGFGVQFYADGTVYEGDWRQNMKWGGGAIYHPDGTKDDVEMERDAPKGTLPRGRIGSHPDQSAAMLIDDIIGECVGGEAEREATLHEIGNVVSQHKNALRHLYVCYGKAYDPIDCDGAVVRLAEVDATVPLPSFHARCSEVHIPPGTPPLERNALMTDHIVNHVVDASMVASAAALRVVQSAVEHARAAGSNTTLTGVPGVTFADSPTDVPLPQAGSDAAGGRHADSNASSCIGSSLAVPTEHDASRQTPSGVTPVATALSAHRKSLEATLATTAATTNAAGGRTPGVSTFLASTTNSVDGALPPGATPTGSVARPQRRAATPLEGPSTTLRSTLDPLPEPTAAPQRRVQHAVMTWKQFLLLLGDACVLEAPMTADRVAEVCHPALTRLRGLQSAVDPFAGCGNVGFRHADMGRAPVLFSSFVEALVRLAHDKFSRTVPYMTASTTHRVTLGAMFRYLVEAFLVPTVHAMRDMDVNGELQACGLDPYIPDTAENTTLEELRRAAVRSVKDAVRLSKAVSTGKEPKAGSATRPSTGDTALVAELGALHASTEHAAAAGASLFGNSTFGAMGSSTSAVLSVGAVTPRLTGDIDGDTPHHPQSLLLPEGAAALDILDTVELPGVPSSEPVSVEVRRRVVLQRSATAGPGATHTSMAHADAVSPRAASATPLAGSCAPPGSPGVAPILVSSAGYSLEAVEMDTVSTAQGTTARHVLLVHRVGTVSYFGGILLATKLRRFAAFANEPWRHAGPLSTPPHALLGHSGILGAVEGSLRQIHQLYLKLSGNAVVQRVSSPTTATGGNHSGGSSAAMTRSASLEGTLMPKGPRVGGAASPVGPATPTGATAHTPLSKVTTRSTSLVIPVPTTAAPPSPPTSFSAGNSQVNPQLAPLNRLMDLLVRARLLGAAESDNVATGRGRRGTGDFSSDRSSLFQVSKFSTAPAAAETASPPPAAAIAPAAAAAPVQATLSMSITAGRPTSTSGSRKKGTASNTSTNSTAIQSPTNATASAAAAAASANVGVNGSSGRNRVPSAGSTSVNSSSAVFRRTPVRRRATGSGKPAVASPPVVPGSSRSADGWLRNTLLTVYNTIVSQQTEFLVTAQWPVQLMRGAVVQRLSTQTSVGEASLAAPSGRTGAAAATSRQNTITAPPAPVHGASFVGLPGATTVPTIMMPQMPGSFGSYGSADNLRALRTLLKASPELAEALKARQMQEDRRLRIMSIYAPLAVPIGESLWWLNASQFSMTFEQLIHVLLETALWISPTSEPEVAVRHLFSRLDDLISGDFAAGPPADSLRAVQSTKIVSDGPDVVPPIQFTKALKVRPRKTPLEDPKAKKKPAGKK